MTYAGPHCDPAEMPEASYTPDMAELCDNPVVSNFREATESFASGGLPGLQKWFQATAEIDSKEACIDALLKIVPLLIRAGNTRFRVLAILCALEQESKNNFLGAFNAELKKEKLQINVDDIRAVAEIFSYLKISDSAHLALKYEAIDGRFYNDLKQSVTSSGMPGFEVWHKRAVFWYSNKKTTEKLIEVFTYLLRPGNIKIKCFALQFAINSFGLNDVLTQTAAAKKIGVTRAAISKEVQYILSDLELRRNAHTKSKEAVKSYQKVQREQHWRRQNKKGGKGANH